MVMINNKLIPVFLLILLHFPYRGSAQLYNKDAFAHTYSIVARDKETGEMAVGVQSHWFSVGTIVSWGRSGVGVVATQSLVNPEFGPDGIRLMSKGKSATEALETVIEGDEGREYRQVAMLDAGGGVSAYTGRKCIASASHITGDDYSVQANMMLNDRIVPAMAEAWERNQGLPLAERVLQVLMAAESAGGDIRGRQSAVLLVVDGDPPPHPWMDKKIDLRVDDHAEPLLELQRLLKVHRAYEHMNRGDVAIETGDMPGALEQYGAAENLFPGNLEMKFWKAVALANNDRLENALPIFREVFREDENWRELTRRLPDSDLLNVSAESLEKILKLK
jgi:uncharacterized Ntn-hydrolase superfamily protein